MSRISDMLAEWHGLVGEDDEFFANKPDLRINLIEEESEEVVEAIEEADRPHIAKELSDLVYVAFGAARAWGIDLDACIAEVHKSNMTKLVDGHIERREDGKILKGPNFKEADMVRVLRESDWRHQYGQDRTSSGGG